MNEKVNEETQKKEQEISYRLGAHCFHCGQHLILKDAYLECPDHGRKWIPENLRY